MHPLTKVIQRPPKCLQFIATQLRYARTDSGSGSIPPRARRRSKFSPSAMLRKTEDKSEWWVVDGEMHEIGDNVPPRERFVIPRENLPNKRRKQLREQFMRRTRLVIKESEHEPWCKRYMELYNELRENWERLYWDEGYSKKLAQDHANYESAEDDDKDFNPYRARQQRPDQIKDQIMGSNRGNNTWDRGNQIRDKFEFDRERRMRERAFAPMNGTNDFETTRPIPKNEPFDISRYISDSDDD
ncbi:F21O3.15 protein [Striga asiatica]|uniref:F21O3.15 protein n=1 Tax=Striga asiatica TaxID=4170 RepID=A0A5A7Q5Z3_STRAF|nr:F21O3.15 protein [Striga asiatica]